MKDIDDLRDDLVEYYIGNPPEGYAMPLDDVDFLIDDMQAYVKEMDDVEVARRTLGLRKGNKGGKFAIHTVSLVVLIVVSTLLSVAIVCLMSDLILLVR